jgi:tRNA-dihydrouridine synthase A
MSEERSCVLAVAPMMDWTDRHCRYLHRLMSRHAVLYTEMVTAAALVHGDAARLLAHHEAESPVILQLGGSDPAMLAGATRMAVAAGFDGVNLNCGCPSDRVQSGAFGACLMREPALVARCVRAMIGAAGGVPVSVKCRIGVDDQNPEAALPAFLDTVAAAGVTRFVIHARKAWLNGLSPKENREVPPLDHALVHRMKARFPALHISLNGGLRTLAEARAHLDGGPDAPLDGAMFGRAVYHDPGSILPFVDPLVAGEAEGPVPGTVPGPEATVRTMLPYIAAELAGGTRLHEITRHMLGLFAGRKGARAWRRVLAEGAVRRGAGADLVDEALGAVCAAAG